MKGKIHDKRTMFLRIAAGDATADNGTKYELSVSASNNAPIVKSDKTGRWFTLSWQDILELAVEAGIDA